MAKDNETIEKEIEAFKSKNDGDYPDYYIGITKDLDKRLFEDNSALLEHISAGKYTEGKPYYSAETESRDDASEIETYFQAKGMLGFNPAGRGDEESKFIYCFKIDKDNKDVLLAGNSHDAKRISKDIKHVRSFENFDKK